MAGLCVARRGDSWTLGLRRLDGRRGRARGWRRLPRRRRSGPLDMGQGLLIGGPQGLEAHGLILGIRRFEAPGIGAADLVVVARRIDPKRLPDRWRAQRKVS